ncbi:GTP-binding protein GEM [Frankliniella fusca]|uniref:GTP-binding protein GEM n=1 Tax=Frankliniella fusca TaxID=407009 RepID=A0AAE1LQY8_9NEOP|nr:GTP-binding protein GEM [Frankliniella fusca]
MPLNEGQPEPHAYCVVYSQADLASFRRAEDELQRLWTSGCVGSKAVILVANKTDLVRSRTVTAEEGKAAATSYDCKFIETSVAINHNVDELLVGILTQIRLKLQDPERTRSIFRKRSASRSKSRSRSPLIVSCVGGLTSTCVGTEDKNGNPGVGEPPGSPGPRCRRNRMSASLKVRGLLDKVWARDSKSKSCENLHVL